MLIYDVRWQTKKLHNWILFLVWADKIPEYFLNFSPMNISQKWENIFSDNPFKVDLTDRTIKNIRRGQKSISWYLLFFVCHTSLIFTLINFLYTFVFSRNIFAVDVEYFQKNIFYIYVPTKGSIPIHGDFGINHK